MSSGEIVCVIGQGYVGLPLAISATSAGWKVFGFDLSEPRVESIQRGISPIEDVSDGQLRAALSSGYEATSDPSCLSKVEIVVLCVPTPLDENQEPDLSALKSAAELIGKHCNSGVLVVNESTSFPGTTRDFIPTTIREVNPNLSLLMAVAPERIDPSNKEWNFKVTPRVVSGTSLEAKEKVENFYRTFCDSVTVVSSPEIAELSKLYENTFRQVNIALVNQIAQVADKMAISMTEVVKAASTKPFGFMPFRASIGVGGHCIPIDPMYLNWYASILGVKTSLISKAQEIIREVPIEVGKRAKRIRPERESKVLLVGISYKAGVSDLRESPAIPLYEELRSFYAQVDWWDELIEEWNGLTRAVIPEVYDLVIVAHVNNLTESLGLTLEQSKLVIDYSGSLPEASNIILA